MSALEAPWGWTERRFLPHVLRDVTEVDLSVPLLGTTARVPWGIAPTTQQRAVHQDGEVAMAQASAAAGSVMARARPVESYGTSSDWWPLVVMDLAGSVTGVTIWP